MTDVDQKRMRNEVVAAKYISEKNSKDIEKLFSIEDMCIF